MTERTHDSRVVAGAPGTSLPSVLVAWCAARRHALVVWGAMTVWSALLFATARSDYLGFRFGRFDFGNMVQAVWSTAHGRPLGVTNVWGDQASRLGSHIDPIFALFAPLWARRSVAGDGAPRCGSRRCRWARFRSSGSHVATSPRSGSRSLLALCYLAYPWLAWTALRAAPGHACDTTSSLLRLGARRGPAASLRPVRGSRWP